MYRAPQAVSVRYRPGWIEDLTTFYRGRIARQFVLHFNITDFTIDLSAKVPGPEYARSGDVVDDLDQLPTTREYLNTFLFQVLGCHAIYTYSLAGGLIALDAPRPLSPTEAQRESVVAWQRLHSAWSVLHSAQSTRGRPGPNHANAQAKEHEIELPRDSEIVDNFKLLGHMLQQPHYARANPGSNDRETPIAVILDYVEKLVPYRLGEGQGDREQLQALEVIQRWALDPRIRNTNNIIILLTTNIGQIPSSVYTEGSGCRAIRVPLPNQGERVAFIRYKMTRARARLVKMNLGASIPAEDAQVLARITQGMRLTDIDNVSRRVIIEKMKQNRSNGTTEEPVMGMDDVQRAKAEVIQAQSEQLLEIVQPVRGFDEIGGLESLKTYLRSRTELMARGESSPLVPSGLLLAGPPGTGKTIIAEALAQESKFNLVKMRNIQDKWVGSSERNLELVINLLKDLHPVVVFVDEIDQAMTRRDSGNSGDSGVGARMFARLLEEMSNASNRGRILWVAATNRADFLDEALLRRFDRVVPLLTPDAEESCRIFATMLKTIGKQSHGTIRIAYGGDLEQKKPADASKFRKIAEKTARLGLTGAGIEIVVRRAIELVYEEIERQRARASGGPGAPEARTPAIPYIEAKHLLEALADYKPNHNRRSYDHQSLLAIRACNFRSVIPRLPDEKIYARIRDEHGEIDPERLEAVIREIERPADGNRPFSEPV
jgi:SpoVK/Ycf46/Vps4 family AAA+-type ATPase